MKLTYDPRRNIAYIRLQKKKGKVNTFHVSDELNIDVASNGTIYGIELLNANKQLKGSDRGNFVLVNEALGRRQEIPFFT